MTNIAGDHLELLLSLATWSCVQWNQADRMSTHKDCAFQHERKCAHGAICAPDPQYSSDQIVNHNIQERSKGGALHHKGQQM